MNIANIGSVRVPSGRRQPGTSTIRSRGSDTAVALCRFAERCSRIVVSDRSVPESRPYFLFPAPERESDPISRMFCASRTSAVGRSFSYRASSAAASLSAVMFPFSFSYAAQPTATAPRTTTATPVAV